MAVLPAALLAAGAAAAYLWRTSMLVRREREVAARLKLGPDGVVEGASPIRLDGSSRRAALMVHGFGDTPQTLAYLADHLHSRGWTVRVPLLPSHGRLLKEAARGRAGAWIACAREEYALLRAGYDSVVVIGLSMGGALSCIIAAEEPPPALVLLAPYLSMPRSIRLAASTYRLWAPLVPYVAGRGEASVQDPRERALSRSAGYTTGRLLRELNKVASRAQDALPSITSPTLVVHSREDNRIPVDAAIRSYARLGAVEKELVWRDRTGHVITVDYGREEIFQLVEKWLDRHVPGSVPGR